MDTAVVFDIDGVLIDSYSGIKIFYEEVLPRLNGFTKIDGEVLFYYEIFSEGLGVLRSIWWPSKLFWLNERDLGKLLEKYWEVRMKYSRLIPGAKYVLERLKSMNVFIGSVSYKDDIPGLKIKRIKMFELDRYFDEIIIVGEDVGTRCDGLKILRDKYGFREMYYVDDKPANLWRIKKVLPWIKTVLFRFQYSPDFPWSKPPYKGDYQVYSLPEIIGLIKND